MFDDFVTMIPVKAPKLYVMVCVCDVLYRLTEIKDVLPILASVAPIVDFNGVAVATTVTFPDTVCVLPDGKIELLTVCVLIL